MMRKVAFCIVVRKTLHVWGNVTLKSRQKFSCDPRVNFFFADDFSRFCVTAASLKMTFGEWRCHFECNPEMTGKLPSGSPWRAVSYVSCAIKNDCYDIVPLYCFAWHGPWSRMSDVWPTDSSNLFRRVARGHRVKQTHEYWSHGFYLHFEKLGLHQRGKWSARFVRSIENLEPIANFS